jgi:hypothetical protein
MGFLLAVRESNYFGLGKAILEFKRMLEGVIISLRILVAYISGKLMYV